MSKESKFNLIFSEGQKEAISLIYDFSSTWRYPIPRHTHELLRRVDGFNYEPEVGVLEEKGLTLEEKESLDKHFILDITGDNKERQKEIIGIVMDLLRDSFSEIVRDDIEKEYQERLKIGDMSEIATKGWRVRRLRDLSQLTADIFDCLED